MAARQTECAVHCQHVSQMHHEVGDGRADLSRGIQHEIQPYRQMNYCCKAPEALPSHVDGDVPQGNSVKARAPLPQ